MADYEQDNLDIDNRVLKTKDGIDRLVIYQKSVGRFVFCSFIYCFSLPPIHYACVYVSYCYQKVDKNMHALDSMLQGLFCIHNMVKGNCLKLFAGVQL